MSVRALLAACAALACAGVSAQTLKPGLWEVSNRMQGGQLAQAQAQMQEQLKNLPPDQRKMVEEMMAKQGVRQGAGGGMNVQVCITKEMAERSEIPHQGDCRTTTQQRTGNTMRVAFACTNPPSSGEGQVTFASPESYTSRMTVKTAVNGKPETMTVEGAGKWLKADCGSLKPMGAK